MFHFESVEPRQLFSFTINEVILGSDNPITAKLSKSGVLTVTGTGGADVVRIEQVNGENRLRVNSDGGVTFLTSYGRSGSIFDLALVKKIVVNTGAGKDYVKVATSQKRITALVEGGGGNDTLIAEMRGATLRGGAGDDYLTSGTQALYYQVRLTSSFVAGNTEIRSLTPTVGSRLTLNGTTTSPGYVFLDGANTNTDRFVTAGPVRIDAAYNVLDGGSGNDRLATRGAEDTLIGGDGSDSVIKLNNADAYFSNLPVLAAPTTPSSNDAPSRFSAFGVDSIVEQYNSVSVTVRRSTILDA